MEPMLWSRVLYFDFSPPALELSRGRSTRLWPSSLRAVERQEYHSSLGAVEVREQEAQPPALELAGCRSTQLQYQLQPALGLSRGRSTRLQPSGFSWGGGRSTRLSIRAVEVQEHSSLMKLSLSSILRLLRVER